MTDVDPESLLASLRLHAPTQPDVPGYFIEGVRSESGARTVYLATRGREIVALKVLWSGPGVSDEERLRFAFEEMIAGKLEHPAIPRVLDRGHFDGGDFIAYEFCEAAPGTPTLKQVVRAIADVADALHAAHAERVVHLDVKPSNVIVGSDRGWLIDFGVAHQELAPGLTRSGDAPGTSVYQAPEQKRGVRDDPRSDVFALGLTLWDLCAEHGHCGAGGQPASVESRSPSIDVIRERSRRGVSPFLVGRGLPRGLRRIIHRATRPDPGARYPSAAEMGADLRHFLMGDPLIAGPIGWRSRAGWTWSQYPGRCVLVAAALLMALLSAAWVATEASRRRAAEDRAEQEAQAASRFSDLLDREREARAQTRRQRAMLLASIARVDPRELRGALADERSALLTELEAAPEGSELSTLLGDAPVLDAGRAELGLSEEEERRALMGAASLLSASGRFQRAEALFARIAGGLEEPPDSPAARDRRLAAINRATALVELGRYQEALDIVERALRDPDLEVDLRADGLLLHGRALARVDRFEEARSALEDAAELNDRSDRGSIECRSSLALTLGLTGDATRGVELAGAALADASMAYGDRHASAVLPLAVLGRLHNELGDWETALAYSTSAYLAGDGLFEGELHEQARSEAMHSLSRLGAHADAIALADDLVLTERHGVAREPGKVVKYRSNRATCLSEAGLAHAAIPDLEAVLSYYEASSTGLDPDVLATRFNLAMALARTRADDDAHSLAGCTLEELQASALRGGLLHGRLALLDGTIFINAGDLNAAAGRFAQAFEILQRHDSLIGDARTSLACLVHCLVETDREAEAASLLATTASDAGLSEAVRATASDFAEQLWGEESAEDR